MVQPDRPQMTIWRMRFACWITKATDTVRICNTYCFTTATMVRLTLYVHCIACLVYLPLVIVMCHFFFEARVARWRAAFCYFLSQSEPLLLQFLMILSSIS
jgi:hypothetical protein